MSTQTEHLGLHQWEAGDSFLRSDFNEDFAKIDAGVKAAHALAGAAKALAEGGFVSGTFEIVSGQEVTLNVGFRPKVMLFITEGQYPCVTIALDNVYVEIKYRTEYSSTIVSPSRDKYFVFQDTTVTISRSPAANSNYNARTHWAAFR